MKVKKMPTYNPDVNTEYSKTRIVINGHNLTQSIDGSQIIDALRNNYGIGIEIEEIEVKQTVTHRYRKPTN